MKPLHHSMAAAVLAMLALGAQSDPVSADTAIADMKPGEICGRKLPNGQYAIDRDLLQKKLFIGIQSEPGFDWDKVDSNQDLSYEKPEIAEYLILNSGGLSSFSEGMTGDFKIERVPASYWSSDPQIRSRIILKSPPEHVIIVCTGYVPQAKPNVAGGAKPIVSGQLRVRLDIKTLPIALTPQTAKGNTLKPAVASVTKNFKKGESTFQVQGVAGYAWEGFFGSAQDNRDNPFQFIPYVGIHQRFNEDNPKQEIDILNGGFLFSAILGANSGIRHGIDADAHFTSDSVGNTKVLSGSLAWSPYIDHLFGYLHEEVFGLVDVYFLSSLEVHVGEVFDDGGNEGLSAKGDFVRAGGRVSMSASGSAGTALENFALTAGYIWLPSISGEASDLARLEAGLAYYFDDLRRFGFGLNYVNGNVDDTLEDVDYLEASLMFRL